MHYYGRRASETNPCRSIPLLRAAPATALGPTPLEAARWNLAKAEIALPLARDNLLASHAALGDANRLRNAERRRRHQGIAMRTINANRARLLAAHNALDAARAEVARLEHEPAADVRPAPAPFPAVGPAFTTPRILRFATASHPAGSTGRIVEGQAWGWLAILAHPDASGTVASFATEAEARAWLDAEFAPAMVH